jgi:hypothetical protein
MESARVIRSKPSIISCRGSFRAEIEAVVLTPDELRKSRQAHGFASGFVDDLRMPALSSAALICCI